MRSGSSSFQPVIKKESDVIRRYTTDYGPNEISLISQPKLINQPSLSNIPGLDSMPSYSMMGHGGMGDYYNMYKNSINFDFPTLTQKDSMFNSSHGLLGASFSGPSGDSNMMNFPMKRNSSILSLKSMDKDDSSGPFRPTLNKKTHLMDFSRMDLERLQSNNKSNSSHGMKESDFNNLKYIVSQIKGFDSLKMDPDEASSPQLNMERSQSASQFLIGPGQGIGLVKGNSFIGGNSFMGGVNNFNLNRESSAF